MALPSQQEYPPQGAVQELKAQQTKDLPVLKTKEQLNNIIIDKNGQPDFLAINIFWDSFRSWYKPLEVHHANGNITKHRKLRTKGIYSSAEKLAKAHGVSKETIRRKLVKLEKLGLIQRSFEHKDTVTTKSYNHRKIFVWKHTPHFFNPYGIDHSEVGIIKPQTNAKYIEEKHNVEFGAQAKVIQAIDAGGGIHTRVDTKELRKDSNKLESRSRSEFLKYSNQFSEKKDITQCMEKITEEQLIEACQMSGTSLNKHAAKEIMAYLGRLKKASFCSMRQFMAYVAKCLAHEKRNPVRCNLLNFKIMKLRTETEKQEQLTLAEKEKYINKVEDDAIFSRSDPTQYKGKLAGSMPKNLAYDILFNNTNIRKVEKTLEIWLAKAVEIPLNWLDHMLTEAKAVGGYMDVDKLEIVV